MSLLSYNEVMKEIKSLTVNQLKAMARRLYGSLLVKAVVDIEQARVVVDARMHVDEAAYLLENGSKPADLWGIKLDPDKFGQDDFIAFDSMVNLRPSQNNNSRGIEDETIRQKIRTIINRVIIP